MNKKISLGAALALLLVVAAVTFSITMIYARNNFNAKVYALKERENNFEKFAEIDRQVRLNYYKDINQTQLMDSVARGYLQGLSEKSSSTYISAEEYKKQIRDTEGEYVGIGADVNVTDDDFYLVVNGVYPESPAQVGGIEVGDLIVKVDDTDLTRENREQQLSAITGAQGTTITVVIRRGSEEKTVAMTRRAVVIPTVYAEMLASTPDEPLVGYMRITDFADRTYDQFSRELQKLIDAGATSLVFDLRDNPGTTLKSAARILDKLLPAGVLASATYKDGSNLPLYTSDANQVDMPMVVIVNTGTASAAEVFAQSIKDFDKGRIVGETTAGRGVLQDVIKLSDGSAIQLTVALLHPGSGLDFNGVGLKPDYEVKALEGDWTKLDKSFDPMVTKAEELAVAGVKASATNSEGEAGVEASAESSEAEAAPQSVAPAVAESSEDEVSEESEAADSSGDESGDESDTSAE